MISNNPNFNQYFVDSDTYLTGLFNDDLYQGIAGAFGTSLTLLETVNLI